MKTKGYAANVHYAQANTALFAKMKQDHIMALANLATATQSDITAFALFTKTIADVSTQVTYITTKLATVQSKNARLKISGHCLAPVNHGHRLDNVESPSDQNPLRDRNIYSRSGQKFDPNGYCSSNELKVKESHTSVTCHYLVDGHKKLATLMYTKGGKLRNKDWINGEPTK